jgi:hypothetical protein
MKHGAKYRVGQEVRIKLSHYGVVAKIVKAEPFTRESCGDTRSVDYDGWEYTLISPTSNKEIKRTEKHIDYYMKIPDCYWKNYTR